MVVQEIYKQTTKNKDNKLVNAARFCYTLISSQTKEQLNDTSNYCPSPYGQGESYVIFSKEYHQFELKSNINLHSSIISLELVLKIFLGADTTT